MSLRLLTKSAFLLGVTVSSCLPIPMWGHTGKFKSLDADSIAFLKIGETTKAEVISRLGEPDWFNQDTFAYQIERYRGGMIFAPLAIAQPFMCMSVTRASLVIEFDANSSVRGARFLDEGEKTVSRFGSCPYAGQ